VSKLIGEVFLVLILIEKYPVVLIEKYPVLTAKIQQKFNFLMFSIG